MQPCSLQELTDLCDLRLNAYRQVVLRTNGGSRRWIYSVSACVLPIKGQAGDYQLTAFLPSFLPSLSLSLFLFNGEDHSTLPL
ncbi:hypothetical protein ACN38_g4664 [Penicillium nordicum]|uniref:Uncharacterized protein n=1 Tax=Penicillium nordicum TaxID=229535 RepID=A0A0M8P6A8_9EURO|nr:hypothetical protein ACN38_g4664 [Penicillium nordicum]